MRTDDTTTRHSRALSWLLRHGARASKLPMDAAGWARIDDVRRALSLSSEALDAAVRDNRKSRLEVRDGRIRACQGHSFEGTPVTREALEASWTPWTDDAPIWHGTRVRALASIAREGLLPGERTHVHLAASVDSHVGKRDGVDVMLSVDPRRLREGGVGVWVSANGVVLVREVPPRCITGLRAETRAARSQEAALRALFAGAGL